MEWVIGTFRRSPAGIGIPNDSVAITSPLFQCRSICQLHSAACLLQYAIGFEPKQRIGDAGAPHSHDDRQEIVGHRQRIVLHPIAGEKKPTRQSLIKLMFGRAQNALRILRNERLDISQHLDTDLRPVLQYPRQIIRPDAQRCSGQAHDGSLGSQRRPENDRYADVSETSDHGRFHRTGTASGDSGNQPVLDEMHMLDALARLLKDGPRPDFDALKIRAQSAKVFKRQIREDAVLDRNAAVMANE